jgi:hypothetical protein
MHDAEWERSYYDQLRGASVRSVGHTDDGFPVIVFTSRSGDVFVTQLSQDREGNGPGFLFGLPNPSSGGTTDA